MDRPYASAARQPSLLLRYGLAVLTTVLALITTLLLSPWLSEPLFALFYLAVIVTTWYGGLWPGLLATALSLLFANSSFFPSLGVSIFTIDGILRLTVEVVVALAISSLTAALRRTTAALRAQREQLQDNLGSISSILESITDGFLAFDRAWRFTYVNREGARALGRSADDLLGKRLWDEFPDLEGASFGLLYKRAMSEGVMLELEDYYAPFDAYFVARAYPSESGLSLFLLNVTERVRAQAALRQSEERYRAFIAQSSEGIWRFELDQPLSTEIPEAQQIDHIYQHAYLAECNDVMAQMYGFSTADELVGARLGDFLVRDDPQNIAYLQAFIRSEYRLVDVESHEVDRSGARRFFLNTLVGVIESGLIVRAWGIQRDVTERKQAAERLEAAYAAERAARREAENALRARELFLSVAAHELKTPLTSIMGQAQLFLRRAEREGQLSERDLRALRTINLQVSRLNKIVLSLLDISRIESGQLSIERSSVDLCALMRQVIEETQVEAQERLIELTCRLEPLIVEGDALRLEQVFHNLLQNALKYSPAAEPIAIELRTQENQIYVAIQDRGIGIPQAALQRLFRRFYRAPNAEREHFSGLGIGLYIVKEIVHLHGGEVLVESAEGQGSTFTVRLPRADQSEGTAA
jgi:PAS domain S-box-containing protein